MKILINEFQEKALKELGLFDENKYIVNRYIENFEDNEFLEVENEQES